jgi:hypothetical protein
MIRYVTMFLLLVFAVGTWAQNSPPGGQQMATPQSVENKASLANANDPSSVRALVDEVFNLPRAFPRMPASLESVVKDRLVQSEISYRQGKKAGVEEQDIVNALNHVAEKLGGPPHSKTTQSQLRVLRMWLALSEPKFMGAGVSRQDAVVGQSINQTMGPIQAVNLMATLIDQKLMNPDFQVTPQEWEETSKQKAIERVRADQVRFQEMRAHPDHPVAAVTSGRSYSSVRRRELEASLNSGISSLTVTEGLTLVEQTLTKLRID